jgi:hypothetical protein
VAALAIGEVFTALVIVFFVLIAEALEHLTVERVRGSAGRSSRWYATEERSKKR